ncbi:MAG: hypothetical protein A3B38_03440 [Candidatus Levybacteria bacterium RIFCSPLOWO2_01_FULL_36_13]|nr:MAG: hypothetical protein A2684_04385 [Candidatus Levybacteria bacterium RIFCSPHIGHO2_01_FULL_36_15b]OGH34730.1 MAG: hypothetical protein A3B38_03440 [Candidatus Levybacteria bacterium RIFCSPLOWO2_01_FULL_36_13]
MFGREIVFVTQYYCELCRKKRLLRVFGGKFARSERGEDYKKEVIEWGRHFHWTDYHRVCAICGKLVKAGELELVVNDGKVKIHPEYTDEYKKIQLGDKFGHLLIVHEKCLIRKAEWR